MEEWQTHRSAVNRKGFLVGRANPSRLDIHARGNYVDDFRVQRGSVIIAGSHNHIFFCDCAVRLTFTKGAPTRQLVLYIRRGNGDGQGGSSGRTRVGRLLFKKEISMIQLCSRGLHGVS